MDKIIRLPFIGVERTRILKEEGYSIEDIKNADAEDISEALGVSKYIGYLIIKSAKEVDVDNVPDELISKETICPICGNVITELEYECGRCGYRIKESMNEVEYQRKIKEYVDTYIALSREPENIELWKRLMDIYEGLGNIEESLDVSLKIDLLREEIGDKEAREAEPVMESKNEPRKDSRKKRFRNGLVNGFGVKPIRIKEDRKRSGLIAVLLIFAIVVGSVVGVLMSGPPYRVDGNMSEWGGVVGYHTHSGEIRGLKVGEYGDMRYVMVNGDLKVKEGLSILVDRDGNARTGYEYKGLGAEYRIWIKEEGGKLRGEVYRFEGEDVHNWSGWKRAGGVKVAGGERGIEMEVGKEEFGGMIKIINGVDESEIIGIEKAVVNAKVKMGGGKIEVGDKIGELWLNNTYKRGVEIRGIRLVNEGNASGVMVGLYRGTEEIGRGRLGGYIGFNEGLNIRDVEKIDVYYEGGGARGTTLRVGIGGISGAISKYHSEGDGYYINASASRPRIDGVYGDWAPYREMDVVGDGPASEDIVSYAKYEEGGESYFYIETRGEVASGIIVPVYTGGPRDSDRDGIPDKEDPYPHDFNNDGTPDEDSYVVVNGERLPDVDGDGIADYPRGEDKWLNTTIPNSEAFPEEYRGKRVSVYIGPVRGAKPIYAYDYVEIYISGEGGYEIGGIEAKYLFRLYGIGGEIKGYEYLEYNGERFVKKNIDFDEGRDLAEGWSRMEFRVPIAVGGREVLYRVVSYGDIYNDTAHPPFMKNVTLLKPSQFQDNISQEMSRLDNSYKSVIYNPDEDYVAGYFAEHIKSLYSDEVNLHVLDSWISSLDLSRGAERTHVFTSKDFVDGNVSHFKEEDYAYQKMRDIVEREGKRPIYRVELLNYSVFREEWDNLTLKTKQWEILHWLHDLEHTRIDGPKYDNPYKISWYDEKEIRTIEWRVYELSNDIDNSSLAFEIAKCIKSIDDAKIGPFLAVYPSKEARLTDWSTKNRGGPTYTVTFQLVRWHSGTSDCNGDNDAYLKITLGAFVYNTPEREDDDTWSAKIILTNSNNTGTTAYVKIENWEDDSGLCGGDDDYGSASFTYNIQTKTWSGSSTTPYVQTSGSDGWAQDWFVIESDDDNEADLGVYGVGSNGDPMYGGWCLNDPWDYPTVVKYYGGNHYWGIGVYVISFYAFYVPAGVGISVYMQPSNYNYDLYLYNTDGNRVAISANGGTTQEHITYTADKSGYWYIGVNATGGYSDWFQFWFTSGPDEKNYIDITPTTGAGDRGYLIQSYGGVTYYDSYDDWKFYISSSWISNHGVIYFWMKPNPNANFNLQLYDPSGTLKASSANANLGQIDYVTYELQSSDSAGWWYARILTGSAADYGNYSIFYWVGYVTNFYAQTDNSGTHTPMHKDNGVRVNYYCLGIQYSVYPNDDYYWTVYVDRGSSYQYASESNLSNDASGHRWISQNPPSGTINTGGSIVGHYYEQYYLTVHTTHDTGYTSGKYFGSDQSYSNPGSGWYDAGCTVTIRVDSPVTEGANQYAFVSWSGSGTGSYTGTSNPASFVIQDVTTETANWNQVPEFSGMVYIVPLLILAVLLYRRR